MQYLPCYVFLTTPVFYYTIFVLGGDFVSKVLVCGLCNMETTVAVDEFPLQYQPIDYNFFGIDSAPSGVGLNLSIALSTLSSEVVLLSMIGSDSASVCISDRLRNYNINTDYIMKTQHTAQSVVLYDGEGRRRIFCDLKDFQSKEYDPQLFTEAMSSCDVLCLCNINYSRSLLDIARASGKTIACDVHTLSDVHDKYNRDFMSSADILFLSNENIKGTETQFLKKLSEVYPCKIFVVGMGDEGALLYDAVSHSFYKADAKFTRKVVNTVGAGDALFSAFVHFYANGHSATDALEYATYFASYKIGESGGANGFISEKELLCLIDNTKI